MERSYRFRLYPSPEQEDFFIRNFGCYRYVYNYFLAQRKREYQENGKSPSRFQQDKRLTALKSEFGWLQGVDATSLQASLQDLEKAYSNFFKKIKNGEKASYPKFKSKRDARQKYRTKQSNLSQGCPSIRVENGHVRLPKIGHIKCKISKEVTGRIISATVSRNPSGKYFVSLCCSDVKIEPFPSTGAVVGLDMGIKSFAVSSDGEKYHNHKYLEQSEKKLARLQRQLSRKSKGSKRRSRAKVKVAMLHEHIANQRNDTLHKLSTSLIRQYDVICLEDLVPKNMVRNRSLAKSISDASWGEFKRQLEYKARWYGKQIVTIDRFYPSSQICSSCGAKWSGTKDLSVRNWVCPECGVIHDRDYNAALNILNEGMRLTA